MEGTVLQRITSTIFMLAAGNTIDNPTMSESNTTASGLNKQL